MAAKVSSCFYYKNKHKRVLNYTLIKLLEHTTYFDYYGQYYPTWSILPKTSSNSNYLLLNIQIHKSEYIKSNKEVRYEKSFS